MDEEVFEHLPSFEDDRRKRIDSGRFYRFGFSIHLPKELMIKFWEKLPADAMLVAANYDIQVNCHYLVIWSEKFPTREPSQVIEELTIVVDTEPGNKIRDLRITRWNRKKESFEELQWPT